MSTRIKLAAVIGGGVIGGGWVARFLLMGVNVNVYDPDPQAERKIKEVLANAQRSMPDLYDHPLPALGTLKFCSSLANAVCGVDWISECVPEKLGLKQRVLCEVQQYCDDSAVVTSSTSGFKPSELNGDCPRPEQIIVAHPFNPVYLVPLVELVGDHSFCLKASSMLTRIGFKPLIVRKEIEAHIADRLLEAIWREGLWLINDGIATTEEIDDSIRYGFGLRWAQMGLFETYRIAGGEAGMTHFIKQFGPALKWPWTKLMDVPDLNDKLVQNIADQSDQQSAKYSIRELERIRDDNLVAIMRSLKTTNWGVGELLNTVDDALSAEADERALQNTEYLRFIERTIPSTWVDYNGHMNDSKYAEVFSHAADELIVFLGANQSYIESGYSYFTVDTHITYQQECLHGELVVVESRIAKGEGKKLQLEHLLKNSHGDILASCKQLLIHVNLLERKSCLPIEPVLSKLAMQADKHSKLDPLCQ